MIAWPRGVWWRLVIEAPQLNCSEKEEAIADKQKGRWYLYQARGKTG